MLAAAVEQPDEDQTPRPRQARTEAGHSPLPRVGGLSKTTATASSLVHAVVVTARADGEVDGRELAAATRAFLSHISGVNEAVAFLSALRQGLLQLDGDASDNAITSRRSRIDAVVDEVLATTVAALFADVEAEALTDHLTGLGNRRAFAQDLDTEVARSRRSGAPLTVVMLDVDGLKPLNDNGGHPAGDDALRAVALALRSSARQSDRAYRQGGDEFALLLVDAVVPDPQFMEERLRRVGAPNCSIGIANSPSDPLDQLVAIADRRLYAGRRRARETRDLLS